MLVSSILLEALTAVITIYENVCSLYSLTRRVSASMNSVILNIKYCNIYNLCCCFCRRREGEDEVRLRSLGRVDHARTGAREGRETS